MEQVKPDTQVLIDIVNTQMPFGKYKGTYISDMPIHYLEWLKSKGATARQVRDDAVNYLRDQSERFEYYIDED